MRLSSDSSFPLKFLFVVATALPACALVVVEEETSGTTSTLPAVTDLPSEPICDAGSIVQCYDGPPGTAGIGPCFGGLRTCSSDGTSWSECQGQVLPVAEDCTLSSDTNCDGVSGCTGKNVWAKDFATDAGSGDAAGVTSDSLGNVFVTGAFVGQVELSGLTGKSDESAAFLAKLDAFGNGQWLIQSAEGAAGASVAATPDGSIVVAGTFYKPFEFAGQKL